MRDVELADNMALVGLVMAQVVVAVFDDRVIVQRPGAPGRRCALHIAEQEDGLIWVHYLLTEGGQDFWSTICVEGQNGTRWCIKQASHQFQQHCLVFINLEVGWCF